VAGTRIERVRSRRELEIVLSWLTEESFGGMGHSLPNPERLLEDPRVLLALAVEEEPQGFARLDLGPGEAECTLFVAPGHRRKGVGRRLLDWALRKAGERKVYAMVEEGNGPARAFFQAQGFRSVLSGIQGWIRWEEGE